MRYDVCALNPRYESIWCISDEMKANVKNINLSLCLY